MYGTNLGGFPAHGPLFTSYKMQKICQGQKKVCAGTKVSCFPEKACNHFVCLQLVLTGYVTGLSHLHIADAAQDSCKTVRSS